MEVYTQQIIDLFQQHTNPRNATPMASYMRNQFQFFGIKQPLRKELMREAYQKWGVPEGEELRTIVGELWAQPYRELHYAALELIDKNIKKLTDEDVAWLESLAVQNAWWDTIDWIAPRHVGAIFLRHPDKINPWVERWMDTDNCWLQRIALLFQLKYKEKTDKELMFSLILRLKDSDEFFIQKAAGWILRQYSKINAPEVVHFIRENDLPKLTEKEGLKWLKNKNT